jgi:CheY-like chemotaxis protein
MNYNVIIADDLEQHVELLSDTLEAAKEFNVVFKASDGKEVIEYLSGTPPFNDRNRFPMPHVLMLDLRMLQVDGFQVLRWVKENRAPVLPIVATSFASPEFEARAMALGAAALLSKPLSPEDILSIVQLASNRFPKPEGH